MTGIKDTREQRRAEKNLVDTRIMRSFGETPGKREALLNKLVKLQETPVKREETPEKGEEPINPVFTFLLFYPIIKLCKSTKGQMEYEKVACP